MKKADTGRFSVLKRALTYANNLTSQLGIGVATVTGVLIVIFIAVDLLGKARNPYLPLFGFVVLPAVFLVGLILIPLGMWRRRRALRRQEAGAEEIPAYPRLDVNEPHVRATAMVALGLTVLNAIIFGTASFLAVEHMDSPRFCGVTCHTVMQPEYTAYQDSPHGRVACVECHIGPGASWFVRTKIDGLRQVWKTFWSTYPRPITTPVHTLRPARETCETCHWPAKHHGDKMRFFARYATDEANTPSYTVMLLKTGGGNQDLGGHGGIHWWHINQDNRIRYVADEKRQEMLWVELLTPTGETFTYTPGGSGEVPADVEKRARLMDCVDCHSRPSHYFPPPDRALDALLDAVPDYVSLPYFKRQAMAAITASYPSHAAGVAGVEQAVKDYYQSNYPALVAQRGDVIARAAAAAAQVYARSVFPEMQTNWETHANHIGHEESPGCFRCHGGDHATADGSRTIPVECDSCHVFLVEGSRQRPDLSALR